MQRRIPDWNGLHVLRGCMSFRAMDFKHGFNSGIHSPNGTFCQSPTYKTD